MSGHRGQGQRGGPGQRGTDAVRLVLPFPGDRSDTVVAARHETQIMGKTFVFHLVAAEGMQRRNVSVALAAAVAELRAVEFTFSPARDESLVARVRRGELRPDAYPPPLADIVARCADMRSATEGWFDAWAVPDGFDPGGMVTGWGMERAAALLTNAGITSFAICGGGDVLVRGHASDGRPWRVEVHGTVLELSAGAVAASCSDPRGARIVNPHTRLLVDSPGSAAVAGPDLCAADAYATALYAAGPVGLGWFPTLDGYTGYLAGDDRTMMSLEEITVELPAPPGSGRATRNTGRARPPRQRMTAVLGNNKA